MPIPILPSHTMLLLLLVYTVVILMSLEPLSYPFIHPKESYPIPSHLNSSHPRTAQNPSAKVRELEKNTQKPQIVNIKYRKIRYQIQEMTSADQEKIIPKYNTDPDVADVFVVEIFRFSLLFVGYRNLINVVNEEHEGKSSFQSPSL